MISAGMHAASGTALVDIDHVRQSIRDILTTRIGSRLMRRDYGSLVPELIDHAGNAFTRLRLLAASVSALARWEPRVRITRVDLNVAFDGQATLDIEGELRAGQRAGQPISLAVRLS